MVPGRGEVRVPSLREWRRNRDRAGELLYLVGQTPRGPLRKQAWRVYRRWANAEISYTEAKKRLQELARQAGK